MALTLSALRSELVHRLGDLRLAIWTTDELSGSLQRAYRMLAQNLHVFWDLAFLENLPAVFSVTTEADRADGFVMFDAGVANYTYADERRMLSDDAHRIGPAQATSPFESADGWLAGVAIGVPIPATAVLPATVVDINRGVWDQRGLNALVPASLSKVDRRYEITAGEVYGFTWQKDGVRTLRKVRVPAAATATYLITGGPWGILRQPTDVSSETITGTWGSPRRIPTLHPIGAAPDGEFWGLPRRPYQDRLGSRNFRAEVWRRGGGLTAETDACELPDRYARYLLDQAQSAAHLRNGPGQSLPLAAYYDARWQRHLARITRRLSRVHTFRQGVLGGDQAPMLAPPPRPSLPWPYGSVVR